MLVANNASGYNYGAWPFHRNNDQNPMICASVQ